MNHLPLVKKAFSIVKSKNNYLPILESVLIMNNNLIITDLQIAVTFKNIGIENDFVLNKKDFLTTIGFIPNFETELFEGGVILKHDGDVFKFNTDDIGTFPVTERTDMNAIGIITDKDKSLLQTAIKFVGKDELRDAMMNVAFKDGHVFATDGHTLFFEKSELIYEKEILISKQVVSLLDLFKESFTISKSDKYLQFENKDVIISQRICDSHYPDVLAVIPESNPIKMSVDKKVLQETIKKALTMANTTTNVVTFNVGNYLLVESTDIDFGKEYSKSIPINLTGDQIIIGFNGKMLSSLLNEVDSKEAIFEMSEPNRPVVINGNILQMPVMIKHY